MCHTCIVYYSENIAEHGGQDGWAGERYIYILKTQNNSHLVVGKPPVGEVDRVGDDVVDEGAVVRDDDKGVGVPTSACVYVYVCYKRGACFGRYSLVPWHAYVLLRPEGEGKRESDCAWVIT